jgi:acyl-CoA thioester hydrolase
MKRFELEMQVRDYECDVQGIVNNAVYQNYLEHTRHEFLHAAGYDFNALRSEGWEPVVVRADIRYRLSLRPRDRFRSTVELRRAGRLRFVFVQRLIRLTDEQVVVEAEITGVFTKNGRPVAPDPFEKMIASSH